MIERNHVSSVDTATVSDMCPPALRVLRIGPGRRRHRSRPSRSVDVEVGVALRAHERDAVRGEGDWALVDKRNDGYAVPVYAAIATLSLGTRKAIPFSDRERCLAVSFSRSRAGLFWVSRSTLARCGSPWHVVRRWWEGRRDRCGRLTDWGGRAGSHDARQKQGMGPSHAPCNIAN
jgi:hypothetical protein